MDRTRLLAEVRDLLAHTGFYVSDRLWSRGLSFDLAARRDDVLLLVKVLLNVDALSQEGAQELTSIAHSLDAACLLVGFKSSGGPLEEGVVYSRFRVPILSPETLQEYLEEGVPPFVFSAPGGLYVRLNATVLHRARQEGGISLGQMATVARVSRRTIQMYLEGMSATAEAAWRLEAFLNEPLILPLDLLSLREEPAPGPASEPPRPEDFQGRIRVLLTHLGYDVLLARRSPFDAITRDVRILFLAGMEPQVRDLRRKAEVVANLSRIVERDPIMFVERRATQESLLGVPIIDSTELRRMRAREEMVELVEERRE